MSASDRRILRPLLTGTGRLEDGGPSVRGALTRFIHPQRVTISCSCGKVLAEMRGHDGELTHLAPRSHCGRAVPDPAERVEQPSGRIFRPRRDDPTLEEEVPGVYEQAQQAAQWAISRWEIGCPRPGHESAVKRFESLATRFAVATRYGRTDLVLGVDL